MHLLHFILCFEFVSIRWQLVTGPQQQPFTATSTWQYFRYKTTSSPQPVDGDNAVIFKGFTQAVCVHNISELLEVNCDTDGVVVVDEALVRSPHETCICILNK